MTIRARIERQAPGALPALVFLLLAAVPVSAAPQSTTGSRLKEGVEVRVHTTRLRVQPTRLAEPGQCLSLGVNDLRVSLRGERLRDPSLVELDREPRRTLHLLLIDTSRSMVGRLDYAREAAREYVNRLDPATDRVMVATFDESVLLAQPATADLQQALDSIAGLRMGLATSMLDGLAYLMREVETYPERPVVVLLTDGVDTASIYERHDVRELTSRRPDLTVFTIGLALPAVQLGGPRGVHSTRRFLYRLAASTNGEFFDVPSGAKLEGVFLRIRELLNNEIELSVLDPGSTVEPPRLRVSSDHPGCRVRMFRRRDAPWADDPRRQPIELAQLQLPARLDLIPNQVYVDLEDRLPHPRVGQGCRDHTWFIEVAPGMASGCALDMTLEWGMLYDPYAPSWLDANTWPWLETRPFSMPIPPLTDLPTHPASALDRLGAWAVRVADDKPEIDPRKVPANAHARPYADHAQLLHGRTLFDLQHRLGLALYLQEDYREWVAAKVLTESERDLAELRARYARWSPGASDALLDAVVADSEEGRRIRARAGRPSEMDVQRFVASWLGDIPAHQLFVAWEALWIERLLQTRETADTEGFLERWRHLRRVFYVPSYTRVVTLLSPVYDGIADRIGFYRVMLPRPGWLMPRVQDWKPPSDLADLPLDLVPDRPFGYWSMHRLLAELPELAQELEARGYHATAVRYELLAQPRKHSPRKAFRKLSVQVAFTRAGEDEGLTLAAEIDVERTGRGPRQETEVLLLRRLALTGASQPDLVARVATAAARIVTPDETRRAAIAPGER